MEIKLKSNEFWGFRSGVDHPKQGRIFRIKKWGQPGSNSRTPGVAARRTRNYANKKLTRRNWN